MSSTPLLERSAYADLEWISVEAPVQRRMPTTAKLVEAIARTKHAIIAETSDSVTIDTDKISAPDVDAVAFAQYADDVWDN